MIKGKQIFHIKLQTQKLVFTVIPKNANTSIKHAILKSFYDVNLEKINIENTDKFHALTLKYFDFIDNQELSTLNNYLKIVILRNPIDRLYSAWNDKIKNLKKPRFGFQQPCSFEHFIKVICQSADSDLDRHFTPQYRFITYNNEILSNYFINLDKINMQWNELQKIVNISNLEHFNQKQYEKQSYYVEDLISKRFQKDFELLNKFG